MSTITKQGNSIPALLQQVLHKIPIFLLFIIPGELTNQEKPQNSFQKAELTEAEKFAARAKRWGLPETTPPSAAPADEDGAKLAARAKRFGAATTGATTGAVVEEDAAKLAARAKR